MSKFLKFIIDKKCPIPLRIYSRNRNIKTFLENSFCWLSIQAEEKRLRDEHISYQEQEARIAKDRQEAILKREEEAKKRVAKDLKGRRTDIKKKQVQPKSMFRMCKVKEKLLLLFVRYERQNVKRVLLKRVLQFQVEGMVIFQCLFAGDC